MERLQCQSCGGELIQHSVGQRMCKYCGAIYKVNDYTTFLPRIELVRPGVKVCQCEVRIPYEYFNIFPSEEERQSIIRRQIIGYAMKYFEENFDDIFELEEALDCGEFMRTMEKAYRARFRILGKETDYYGRYS